MSRRLLVAIVALALAPPALADEAALLEKIEQLEQRIQELESNQSEAQSSRASESSRSVDWTRRIRLSGSADAGLWGGQQNSLFDDDGFLIWDSRFFLDAYLGEDVRMGDLTLFRDLGLTFEWNLVRLGRLQNDVGDLFVDFQGVASSDWLNFQVGRFQIPVGESYLQYGKGYAARPFVSNSLGPWWWDEGARFYGSGAGIEGAGKIGYVASVSNGDTPFNVDTDSDKQLTLKLYYEPLPWLRVSASGLRTGEIGDDTTPAQGALWLGESWARAFGSGTTVPSFQNGVAVPDGPNRLRETWFVGGDTILNFEDRLHIWGAYGQYRIDSQGGSFYDRTLQYWIAELIVQGAWLGESFRPFYTGFRAQSLGTTDSDDGYLLDVRRSGSLGYNMHELAQYSTVLGWDITEWLRLRAEYTVQDIEVVRGVTNAIRDAAHNTNYFAVELGGDF